MSRLFLPNQKPLLNPSSGKRLLRPPDLRSFSGSWLSGQPVTDGEVDFDELLIHRSWRVFDNDEPGVVRYLMFEFSQKNPGTQEWMSAVKAVRFVRLTRVPRYLRQSSSGAGTPNLVFEQHRDVLAALRAEQVLFVNLIAKSPDIPLVFAYGVQAVGATPLEAQRKADEAYAVLTRQLDGTYQQLQYAPLTLHEAEALSRYQAEWDQIAVGRGKPFPRGTYVGAASVLDGNRTDIENTNNQLESFIRGMADRSFMLSLVTVPLSPAEIALAWQNITDKLSDVRSEQEGSRAIMAGVALPLTVGQAMGDSSGNTHSSGFSQGVGATDAMTRGESVSVAAATSVTDTVTAGQAQSQAQSVTDAVSSSEALSQAVSIADSVSQSQSLGQSTSLSESLTSGVSAGQSLSQSVGLTDSVTSGQSASQSVGVTDSLTAGSNWSESVGQSTSASQTLTDGWNQALSNVLNQTLTQGTNTGDNSSTSNTNSSGSNFSGGVGINGGQSSGTQNGTTAGVSAGQSWSNALSGGSSASSGISSSLASGLTQGVDIGQSAGGSVTQGQSVANTNTVGLSQSVGQSLSQTQAVGSNFTESLSRATGLASGVSEGVANAAGRTVGENVGTSQAIANTRAVSDTVATTQSQSVGRSVGETSSVTQGASTGSASSLSQNQALNDAFMVAQSRNNMASTGLGVVPNFGVSVSRRTLNASKVVVGDLLEAQMRRYLEGIESGAFLYQMFLVCPDRETLVGGSGLLKSAFWGAGSASERLPQPFHVINEFDDPAEAERLRSHAVLFTSYRRREERIELIEPFKYSTYVTPGELATVCYPPTSESLGLLAVHDSMPVLAMPADRAGRDITLGRLIDGERARVSNQPFGVDVNEITHTLVAGVTGSGKSTTVMRLLYEAARVKRRVVVQKDGVPEEKLVPTGVLALDWMRNLRNLAQVVEPERFRFFSISKPALGAFRWNPLAVPDEEMDPADWRALQADNFVASMNLGEFGRALIDELVDDLYRANRLVETVLRPEVVDDAGSVLREALLLPAVDPASLPPGAIVTGDDGEPLANVYSCPALSRLVGMEHLAVLVAARIEEMADPNAARMYGTAMRDRLQSLWRRVQYFAPGNKLTEIFTHDDSLDVPVALQVRDLIDPDRGLVTVVETDGLDLANRRLILGSVLMAVYRYGLHHGEGVFDHRGKGPGTFVVLEESHELFGDRSEDEDGFSADTRTALYESLFRRSRALGLRLVAVAQNPADIPAAVTSNTTTVLLHRVYDKADRDKVFSMINWSNMIGQQMREWRYLGEMPQGYCIARLDAKDNYLQSAPVQFLTDPAPMVGLDDEALARYVQPPSPAV